MWIGHFVILFFRLYDRSIESGPLCTLRSRLLWPLAAAFVSAASTVHLVAFEAGGTLSE